MIKLTIIAATAILMASAPALATNCYERTTVVPDDARRDYSAIVRAGSATSNGYSGIPGEFGCPEKAAFGTCPDRNASLSNKVDSYLGQFVAYDGYRPDLEEFRKGILIPPTKWTPEIWIGTQWKPGSCP